MGRLDEERLLTCLIALRGKDPTRNLGEHYHRNPSILKDAVLEALPVMRRVLSFLRETAAIPHLRLLPKSILLDVLARFFVRHENPSPRTRALLARWFWRSVFGSGIYDDRTLRRRGINAVGDDEEASVQRLLALLHKEASRPMELSPTFDARADASRITMLALAHLGPRELWSGERLRIAELLEEEDKEAFVKIVRQTKVDGARSPANRMIQAGNQPVAPRLVELLSGQSSLFARRSEELAILESHAVSIEAAKLLQANDMEGFLAKRAEVLTRTVRDFVERMAAWQHNDRPSLDHILTEAGVEL